MPDGFSMEKPKGIDEMFALAARLSEGFPFVRVDFFCVDGCPRFGEMTFYPQGGFDANLDRDADMRWGAMIDLEKAYRRGR